MSALIPALIKLLINGAGGGGGGGRGGRGGRAGRPAGPPKPQMSEDEKNWYYLNRAAVQQRIKADGELKSDQTAARAAVNDLNNFDPAADLLPADPPAQRR